MTQVLIVGAGAREHALAWKLTQSPFVDRVWLAPGNAGTAPHNLPIGAEDVFGLLAWARAHTPDLTVVGPEVPLALGLVDAFQAANLRCFGPTAAAARLESSKVFAKNFMTRHLIPTAPHAVFTHFDAAAAFVQNAPWPLVIKASGLAAGKGVFIPDTTQEALHALHLILVSQIFGPTNAQVVIEQRLQGPELSLLAFCDGHRATPMPPARDYKRAFNHDQGPNTGGMGAIAPCDVSPDLLDQITHDILQRAIDGMRADGTPYKGILYAGLILTPDGPKTLEFNCRFGDPEAQTLLPLLASDLLPILDACIDGQLSPNLVRWHPGAAATVVMASQGYPGDIIKNRPIHGIDQAQALPNVTIFHAATSRTQDNILQTSGGRVLSVTATAPNLPTALDRAYAATKLIHFEGTMMRQDIGATG